METQGDILVGDLGAFPGGTQVTYKVCLQDSYLNTQWSEPQTIVVGFSREYSIVVDQGEYPTTMISNSTGTSFAFSQDEALIHFNMTGDEGTKGYCNLTFPKQLLGGPYTCLRDNELISPEETSNASHTSLFFEYRHTSHIDVRGSTVIPEFPSTIITIPILIMLGSLLLLTTILRKHRFLQ
jgi:hypothetical protein